VGEVTRHGVMVFGPGGNEGYPCKKGKGKRKRGEKKPYLKKKKLEN